MPKMKTHRGAAKRFKRTKSGKFTHRRANRAHILTKKSAKRKLRLRSDAVVADVDVDRVRRMLGK